MMAARFRLLLLLAAAAEAVHSTAAMAGAEKIMESLEVVASRNATVSFPATKADGPRSYYVARASGPALVAGVVERATPGPRPAGAAIRRHWKAAQTRWLSRLGLD